jgi:tripartite-type tricarboxylate transporter receptor subunit TctC
MPARPFAGGLPRRGLLGGLAAGALAPAAARPQPVAPAQAVVQALAWPAERVTFVTSLPAGSSVDLTTRLLADPLARFWGRPVVVDNRGGGNGLPACQFVARARPDGLTLLSTSAMTHAANPALYDRLPYDPVADFAAVTRFGRSPFVVLAQKGLGTPTLAALVARLRAEPGQHNFGWGAVPARVAAELFLREAGVRATDVAYRGNQAAFPDLLEGRLSFQVIDVVGAKPLVDRGEVVALAVTEQQRHPALPGVPSAVEAGLPGLRFTTWSGIYAPRATPPEVVAQVQRDIVRAFAEPAVQARFAAMGGAQEPPSTPEDFAAFTLAEIASWGALIRAAGLRLE